MDSRSQCRESHPNDRTESNLLVGRQVPRANRFLTEPYSGLVICPNPNWIQTTLNIKFCITKNDKKPEAFIHRFSCRVTPPTNPGRKKAGPDDRRGRVYKHHEGFRRSKQTNTERNSGDQCKHTERNSGDQFYHSIQATFPACLDASDGTQRVHPASARTKRCHYTFLLSKPTVSTFNMSSMADLHVGGRPC